MLWTLTGGWDRKTEKLPEDVGAQIDQAFDNVQETLRVAGIENGWEEVCPRTLDGARACRVHREPG